MAENKFLVEVLDQRVVRYVVKAQSEEEARELVEASTDADNDFGSKTIDSTWSIEDIRRAP